MSSYALVKILFCANYEGDFIDASDITAMLNIHFDWIMILQAFPKCYFKNMLYSW